MRLGRPADTPDFMDTSTISALAGISGTLIGGSAAAVTAWITQRTLNKRELVRDEMRKREMLYGEFIGECAKLLMDALTHTMQTPETLLPVYASLNRIRLTASGEVLAEAEHLVRRITEQYFSRNLSVEEIRQIALSENADPMKTFGEACRAELKAIRTAA
jgi:hypothetical protein